MIEITIPYIAPTKADLIETFAKMYAFNRFCGVGQPGEDKDSLTKTGRILASSLIIYNPTIYRGGWVIPNFGWSTERIVRTSETLNDRWGNPLEVGEWTN